MDNDQASFSIIQYIQTRTNKTKMHHQNYKQLYQQVIKFWSADCLINPFSCLPDPYINT